MIGARVHLIGAPRVTQPSMPSDKHFANAELLSSIQEVANFVASYFRSVSGELSLHQCEPVKTPCGKTRLSGRISYFETHSFTDSNRVAREFFLHLGFAALGSVRAVRTTASIRSKIWHQLRHALREGALSDDRQIFVLTMNDGELRIESVVDGSRAVLHGRAIYKPAFVASPARFRNAP